MTSGSDQDRKRNGEEECDEDDDDEEDEMGPRPDTRPDHHTFA